jgi:hypothetical protein
MPSVHLPMNLQNSRYEHSKDAFRASLEQIIADKMHKLRKKFGSVKKKP